MIPTTHKEWEEYHRRWQERADKITKLRERFPDGLPTSKKDLRALDDETIKLIRHESATVEAQAQGHGGHYYKVARRARANCDAVLKEREARNVVDG